jgi:predicted nucleic acid-binding protein
LPGILETLHRTELYAHRKGIARQQGRKPVVLSRPISEPNRGEGSRTAVRTARRGARTPRQGGLNPKTKRGAGAKRWPFGFLEMKQVYFDTNIYTHINNLQHGITNAERTSLFESIRADKIRVYLSSAVLEETVSGLLTNEKQVIQRLRLIHRISKRKRILNEYRPILDGLITAYANNHRVPSFFISPPPYLKVVLRNQSRKTLDGLRELAQDSQKQIQERKDSIEKMFGEKIRPLVVEEKQQGRHQSFEDYWKEHSASVVEIFARLVGVLPECEKKGITGLLEHTPMKAITVAILSQGYANTYEKTTINRGDSRDLHHVVYASAVGTLVTHDKNLAKVMMRVPVDGLEVMDLHALLKSV